MSSYHLTSPTFPNIHLTYFMFRIMRWLRRLEQHSAHNLQSISYTLSTALYFVIPRITCKPSPLHTKQCTALRYSAHNLQAISYKLSSALHFVHPCQTTTSSYRTEVKCWEERLVTLPGQPTNQPTNQLRGFSPRANYTDRATAACRQS
jgi:hypothetical protein